MTTDERVTLRLPKADLELLDVFIEAGIHRNRSEAIRQAISDYIVRGADDVEARLAARRRLAESAAEVKNLSATRELNEKDELLRRLSRR